MAETRMADGAPAAEGLGWRLGMQAYTFHMNTFYEAIDNTESLGLRWIEAFPGQKLSPEKPDAQMVHTMPKELYPEVKQKLASAGVKLVCYGVCNVGQTEESARVVFDFAKAMGIENIVSEPAPEMFDILSALCDEYGINVALHNHPKPSPYWSPDTVLERCKGKSERIGSCSDTGHWMRSEVNPVEALKKLEGRIKTLHLKDLNQFGPQGHDVPWGTGKADVKAILRELLRQDVKAPFSIEYEHNWGKAMPEIAECVKAFDRIAAEVAAEKKTS